MLSLTSFKMWGHPLALCQTHAHGDKLYSHLQWLISSPYLISYTLMVENFQVLPHQHDLLQDELYLYLVRVQLYFHLEVEQLLHHLDNNMFFLKCEILIQLIPTVLNILKKFSIICFYVFSGGTIKPKASYLLEYPTNKQLTLLESSFFSYGIYSRASIGQPKHADA